jgi:hypothetical protein
VTEPRDEIDDWLDRDVQMLAPPPGAFERVRRRARRRKLNQALLAGAGAAVVVAAAVVIPLEAAGLFNGGPGRPRPVAEGSSVTHSSAPAQPRKSRSASAPTSPATGSASAGTTGLSATTSGTAAPPNFQPTSITMISEQVGAVIGQAGTPGHCSGPVPADCTSLAGTPDYGARWYGVSAPVTGPPDGATGVSQLRFLDLGDGWAYGPQLYETSDGGRSWTAVPTFGQRVTDLEAAGARAFVVLASCQGGGSAFAADCTSFSLYSATPGGTALQPVRLTGQGAAAVGQAGPAGSASLVIAGHAGQPALGTGYFLASSRDLYSGSVSGGPWRYAGTAPCAPGRVSASGGPGGGQLATGSGGLLLDCADVSTQGGARGGVTQVKQLWQSATGATWTKVSQPPAAGQATSLAGASTGQAVLATTAGIDYSADGSSWRAATITSAPPGGFSYVGLTSATMGVAVPADARLGEVFITRDGGQTWTPSPISG